MKGFQKAVREQIYGKVLLGGASGSGKTYTALRLAKGIVNKCGGKIAMINTEGGRGKYYSKEFDYDILDLEEPFTPEKYIEAINIAVEAGYSVLIIDSTTHEWKCINEIHDNMPGNSFQNWSKLKPRQFKFSEAINKAPIHIIATGRGKDEYVMEEKNGKQNPKKVGVGIQGEKDAEYEYTVTFNIAQDTHVADVMKDNTHIFENKYEVLTEKHGEMLYDWANDGEVPFDFDGTRTQIIDLATELGGSKDEEVSKIVNGVNPKKCDDKDILTKMLKELTELKETRKKGEK